MNTPNPFVVITPASKFGGAEYPFLKDFSDWMIVSSPLELEDEDLLMHPLASVVDGEIVLPDATFEYVKDNKVVTVYIPGINEAEFLELVELNVVIGDGIGLSTAKRISRVNRPLFVHAMFDSLSMTELDLGPAEMKALDGGGVVHPRVLARMIEHLPRKISDHKRRSLIAKLKHNQRVEFTIVDAEGERKGHAMVSDAIDVDFLIPLDRKTDLKLTSGKTYVSFDLSFKGKVGNLLDRQSLLNLAPFFHPGNLLGWMRQDAEFFKDALEHGKMAELMGRVEADDSEDSVIDWHVQNFAARGGDFMWSRKLVRDVFGQHINKIKSKYQDKLRFPIPGGSAYVMTDAVAKLAGYTNVNVARGECMIDLKRATVWVNSQDWVSFIANTLGGADSDDRLNAQPFTEISDDVRKIMLWRSPNQLGEYVILLPTANSDVIEWATAGEPVVYPKMDSTHLTRRIDQRQYTYTGILAEKVRLPAKPYSVKNMRFAISRALANSGALGMYCNMQMVMVAAKGDLPDDLYLPLGDVVDAVVKDGRDVSGVKDWCYFQAGMMLAQGTKIPHLVADKFAGLIGKDKSFALTTDHWLDKLETGLNQHILYAEHLRDSLMATCVMPAELSAYAASMHDAPMGVGFLQVYNTAMHDAIRKGVNGLPSIESYEAVRQHCERYLDLCHGDINEIMIGVLNAANVGDRNDSAAWQLEGEGEVEGGFARLTIEALCEIGLLNDIDVNEAGLVVYPRADACITKQVAIRITSVWFQLIVATDKDVPADMTMGELVKWSPDKAKAAKNAVRMAAASGKFNTTWTVDEYNGRKVLKTVKGNIFGFIHEDHAAKVGATVKFVSAFATDGNLTAVIEVSS